MLNNHVILYKQIRKYCKRLLIPSVAILFIFTLVMDIDFIKGLTSELKYGYWFTFAYFGIAVIWALFNYTMEKLLASRKIIVYMLEMGGVILLLASHQFFTKNSESVIVATLSLDSITYYYFFFYAGILAKRNNIRLHKLMGHPYLFLIVVTMACMPLEMNKVLAAFIKLARILCIYNLFYYYRASPNTEYINKYLGFIGRHTLEIYFIHYFLLFGLPHIPTYLATMSSMELPIVKGCTSFVEFLIVGTIAIIIVVTCLLIRKLTNCVPVISKLCFGS